MKTFIAYRFTGEDPKQLEPILRSVRDALAQKGVTVYCSFFDEEHFQDKAFSARQIMDHTFEKIDAASFLFVLLTSSEKSEGLLMEVGYCLAKGTPIIVAVKASVTNTYVPDMGNLVLEWDTLESLVGKIGKVDINQLNE